MTAGNDASSSSLIAPEVEALRLLALEMASQSGADEAQRRLISAAAPLLGVLFRRFLTHDIQAPEWPDRDRFVISSSMQPLACALLRLLGRDAAEQANGDAGLEGDDPVSAGGEGGNGAVPVDNAGQAETGGGEDGAGEGVCDLAPRGLDLPLDMPGHGLAAAVGMGLATALLRQRFGAEVFNHATWALIDDRDVEPGVAQESIAIAPWLAPHRLVVLHLTAVGEGDERGGRQRCPNHLARFAAAGWHVQQARADDEDSIEEALRQALEGQDNIDDGEARPAYVAVEYVADRDLPDITALRGRLGWHELAAGEVPGEVCDEWRLAGLKGRKARKAWQQRVEQLNEADRQALARRLEQPLPEEFRQRMRALRTALAEQGQEHDLQGMLTSLLARSLPVLPEMAVLSSLHDDLPDGEQLPVVDEIGDAPTAEDLVLPVLDVGLRPMALAALLTGMAAHGGVRPVGVALRRQLAQMLPLLGEAARAGLAFGLFVVEKARCRHVPAEALPAGVEGLFPADAVEMVECWQLCVQQPAGPAVVFLPEGVMPGLRTTVEKANLSALGGYEFYSGEESSQAVIFAAGQSLGAALAAAEVLEQGGVPVRLVSLPAPERLMQQDKTHRERIIGTEEVRVLAAPGSVARLWMPVLRHEGVVSSCDAQGVPLEKQALATLIRQRVRAGLDTTLLDTARQGEADGARDDVAGDD